MSEPMPYEPGWYRAAKRCHGESCHQGRTPCQTPDACRIAENDDDFGAVGAVAKLWPALITAWILIAATAAFFWIVMP